MYVSNIYPVFHINDKKKLPNYYLLRKLKSNEYKVIINDYCLGGARADLKLCQLSKIKIEKPSKKDIERINRLSTELSGIYQRYTEVYKEIMS